ncbi:cystathionine gamma-lyase [Verticillium alfalfae VaMs.102]|uniref:cystathionine gamma-lyase n=1 Tax=Verticillium alfalfae (strain VaMs.102 / ATCC MYA-4576 / FGSC 10136) TaxID=526221 RepID=C9SMM7_VERA1|nr:cystathionine gamma-lyase [Verticillium alfalfae VaMs.102]EEY20042.1 cystathionine gamma-lyase [Verticillium alfalfae VaMs.102]
MTVPLADHPIETPPRAPSPVHNFGTLAVHAGSPHDPTTGAVIESISLSTTFAQTAVGKPVGEYEYSRSSNPNRHNFETAVAALEKAKYALAFSSGSATTAVVLQSLAAGSHVISVSDVYGGTHRYFTQVAKAHGVKVTFTPEIEVDISAHITPQTKLIWIETPSNPTLRLVDVRAVATQAHQHGIQVVVDNTFLSPYVQNPLDLGADIVVHSVTKYINGHSDVVMGVAAFNSDDLHARLSFLQNAIGAVPSAFDSWLAHRGLKTLHLRAREPRATLRPSPRPSRPRTMSSPSTTPASTPTPTATLPASSTAMPWAAACSPSASAAATPRPRAFSARLTQIFHLSLKSSRARRVAGRSPLRSMTQRRHPPRPAQGRRRL